MLQHIITGSDVSVSFDGENVGNWLLSVAIDILPAELIAFHFQFLGTKNEITELISRLSGKQIRISAPGLSINGNLSFAATPPVEQDRICEVDGFLWLEGKEYSAWQNMVTKTI